MIQPSKADILDLVTARAKGRSRGSVRLEMPEFATFYVDESGAVESDWEADITLTAAPEVFYGIATGEENPAKAFMMRKLKVDGSTMKALKIGEILSSSE